MKGFPFAAAVADVIGGTPAMAEKEHMRDRSTSQPRGKQPGLRRGHTREGGCEIRWPSRIAAGPGLRGLGHK